MGEVKEKFVPRLIDRVLFGIFGILHLANAVYIVGPWYIEQTMPSTRAPLLSLLNDPTAVTVYGCVLAVNAILLVWVSLVNENRKFYSIILRNSLLSGFLLRLYALLGVILGLSYFLPPGYLSHAATVVILGAYWIWVKVNERPIK